VSRLRDSMIAAAEEDITSNKDRLPATSKLRMLPQVMDVLQKSGMSQSILDNNLLEGVRRWLEPLPDRSLPALNIQNAFFETLSKMFIDTNSLKESGLGRVVVFYTKCKRVTPRISRIANTLVTSWSRPIIKRSASYRDRHVPLAAETEQPASRPRLHEILRRAEVERKYNRARLPQSSIGTYQVAPRSSTKNPNIEADLERRRRNAERMRAMTRHLKNK
jgi:transcription factor SPN1